MAFVQVLFYFVVVLGVVIFVHELGHFLVALWRGVTVRKFSLGIGPEMVGWTSGGIRYCLSWIPLGGFVQMAGDHLEEDGSLPAGGQEQFLTHHWLGRIAIAVAGPAANLVFAFVVLVGVCIYGITYPDFRTVLGNVAPSSSAYQAGLRTGDTIVELGGRRVGTWHELEEAATTGETARPLGIVVMRQGQRVVLQVSSDRVRAVLGDLAPESSPPIVGALPTGLPAYQAGIQVGDRIVAVDGKPVKLFEEIGQSLRGKADQPVHFTVLRAGRTLDLVVKPINPLRGRDTSFAYIGVEAPRGLVWVKRYGPVAAVRAGFRELVGELTFVYTSMWMTISGLFYFHSYVGGPIYIAQMARDAAQHGLDELLRFIARINLAVMALNLLPIPLFDGGHILLALFEGLRRRALSARGYINFQKVGLVLVGTLFVLIISQDIVRPLQRMRALDRAPRETTTVAPSNR